MNLNEQAKADLEAINDKLTAILLQHDTRLVAAAMGARTAISYGALVRAGVHTAEEVRGFMTDLVTLAMDNAASPEPAPIVLQDPKARNDN